MPASRILFVAALCLAGLSPALGQSPLDDKLRVMVRTEGMRMIPNATPIQLDAVVACGMDAFSRLTEADRQLVLDNSSSAHSVLPDLNRKYPGLGVRLDMCDNAARAGVDLIPGPGRDALDGVIQLVVFDRIPATETARRTGALECIHDAFDDVSEEHRNLVASEGMSVSEPTVEVLEAAYPGISERVQACNRFL